jgi:hypothetical protein
MARRSPCPAAVLKPLPGLALALAALLAPSAMAWQEPPRPEPASPAPPALPAPPVPADWPEGVEWIGDPPPAPEALAADPQAFAALLDEQGLGLDVASRTVTARGGTLHDRESMGYPVEYVLVTDRGRTHEALFVVKARPSILDSCLRAVGLRPGTPMRFRMKDDPPSEDELAAGASPWEAVPSSGPLVAIAIAWTDDAGLPHRESLESLLLDVRTGAPLAERGFTYVGGRFGPLRQGKKVVQTHVTDLNGNVVAVYLDGEGLCLFERNSLDGIDDTLYTINPERSPKRGTPVTVVFTPTGQEVAPPPPPPSQDVVEGELGRALDEYLRQAAARGFSGAVHVARGGAIVLEKGYGVTALERGAPITGATVFPLGPLSHRVVAAAVLRAAAAGTLDLDAPLSTYVRNVPLDKVDLRPRHLLEQRSGLPAHLPEAAVPDRDLGLRAVLDARLVSPIGERCLPSDAGLALLVVALEDAAEDTWRGHLWNQVLSPARMTGAGLYGEPRWEESRLARGNRGEAGLGTPAEDYPDWTTLAAGGVVAGARDLGRFERWLGEVSAEAAAFAPPCDADAAPWRITTGEHGRCLVMSGGPAGFRAELRRWLDEDVVLIVLANIDHPAVIDGLTERLFATGG